MKPTALRSTLLLALAAAAASTGCMGAYVAGARFNPIGASSFMDSAVQLTPASDRADLEHAQRARTVVYVSLGSSAAVVAYVLLL